MANYDRRLLVPYLQDLCAVELTCAQIENDIDQCERDIHRLYNERKGKVMPRPVQPIEQKLDEFNMVGCAAPAVIGTILGLLVLVLNPNKDGVLAAACDFFLLGVCGSVALLIREFYKRWKLKKTFKEQNRNSAKCYEMELQEYNDNIKALAAFDMEIKDLQNACNEKKRKLQKATSVRNKVYSVNIIPNHYRNIYAAYYLYDFMSTSRETDLEKVIQTFVLEEIKQRLDKIIMQNNQVLINQRVQLAMQEKQNRMVAENHREEMRNIARLEANQERQLDYQNMIAANQEVTNYILAEDYFRKYDKRILH